MPKKIKYLAGALALILLLAGLFFPPQSPLQAKLEEIVATLQQAQEVSPLNIETATGLIAQAEKDLAQLKKITKNKKEITAIESIISDYKKKILKADERSYVEFFDLSVEDKGAKGTAVYLLEDTLYILNPDGLIYEVSLSKKSINKHQDAKIKKAKSVAASEETIYFLKSDGVYSLTSGKSKKIIGKEESWKEVAELRGYAGNLYLLDRKVANIFKYSPLEKGFSKAANYLRPDPSVNIKDPVSFAIDGSVYVATQDNIFKFINGYREAFSFYIPEEIKIQKIYTNENLDSLFVFDREKGKIFILDKGGSYLRQIKSEILRGAQDFVVFEEAFYVFSASKIYKITL